MVADEDENIPITFNPCHPQYGIWGTGEAYVTGGAVINFLTSGFSLWLQDLESQGIDVENRYEEIQEVITDYLYGILGQPLTCPNINYDEDVAPPPAL